MESPRLKNLRTVAVVALALAISTLKSDTHQRVEEWARDCDIDGLVDETERSKPLDMDGFRSNPHAMAEQVSWPEGPEHPFESIQPTFDDGPHPNDRLLIQTLQKSPFKTPVFYYNGFRFFKPEVFEGGRAIEPGGWQAWVEANRGEQTSEQFILEQLDPERVALAREVAEAGYKIEYHGMTHDAEESEFHVKNLSREAFEADLEFFEWIIRIATQNPEYVVTQIRPPYGAGTNDILEKPFHKVCEERGIEVRNWSFSSNDWESQEIRGEWMMAHLLRVVHAGKTPDILYHSQHQSGSTEGGFGKLLDNWLSQVMSLTLPERQSEVKGYREILEAVLKGKEVPSAPRLVPSAHAVGSVGQILIDSSYNTELEPQYMGALQTQLLTLQPEGKADGYIGQSTIEGVEKALPENTQLTRFEIGRLLRNPEAFLDSPVRRILEEQGADFSAAPDYERLMQPGVTFANRGLQVRSIALDILCRGGVDVDFLERYTFNGDFHIAPRYIPVYVEMYEFLRGQGLDEPTAARIVATAIVESGLKTELDEWGLGKGTVEWAGETSYRLFGDTETIPGWLRKVGLSKPADVARYGLGSIGPGQVPLAISWSMFEVILGRNLTREEVETILKSPQGAALGIYLRLHQNERRLASEEW